MVRSYGVPILRIYTACILYSTYSLDDVLCLLVYVYSISGQSLLEQEDEESQLQVGSCIKYGH